MDQMPAIAMISTTTTRINWYCKIRLWTLMVSILNVVISTFEMLQISFLFDIMSDEFEDDGTVFTLKFFSPNSRLIAIGGMASYMGIILINVGFIHEVLKRDFVIKYSWLLYFFSLVQTMSLFYYALGAFFPILIITVRYGFKTQIAILMVFESLFVVLFMFYAYTVYYNTGNLEKKLVVLSRRTGTQTV